MAKAVPLIEDNSLLATDDGYQVRVRLTWYRSLQLSCVEKVRLALDGEWVNPEEIRFGINDHEYQLSELTDLVSEFWFVQDAAVLHIKQPGKVASGESHTIEVEIATRAPYIPIGPNKYLTNSTTYRTTQIAG
jgi:hypothetical protein